MHSNAPIGLYCTCFVWTIFCLSFENSELTFLCVIPTVLANLRRCCYKTIQLKEHRNVLARKIYIKCSVFCPCDSSDKRIGNRWFVEKYICGTQYRRINCWIYCGTGQLKLELVSTYLVTWMTILTGFSIWFWKLDCVHKRNPKILLLIFQLEKIKYLLWVSK